MSGHFRDVVEIELTSADIPSVINTITANGIPVEQVKYQTDLVVDLCVRKEHLRSVQALCEKRGEEISVIKKRGFGEKTHWVRRRPVLVLGLFVILLLAYLLPTRIYFVKVEGNETLPDGLILSAAEECGITFGALRRGIRSEQVKNALLESLPQLKWAGVNTYGCVAVISVRERETTEESAQQHSVSSIVASRDGVITSLTVLNGSGMCQVGQAVTEGQVLISGYTDCGICIQVDRAEGEVFAQTYRELTAITPLEYTDQSEIQWSKQKISILVGKKRINLWKDSGISDVTCDRMYEEYYITLPGGFRLPVAIVVEGLYGVDNATVEIDDQKANEFLTDYIRTYLSHEMIAGEILQETHAYTVASGCCSMTGSYICTEMIGRVRQEMIGEIYGETN